MKRLRGLFGRPSHRQVDATAIATSAPVDVQIDHIANVLPESDPIITALDSSETGAAHQPELAPPQRRITGAVDGFTAPNRISGWAIDVAKHDEPILVHAFLDEQEIGAGSTYLSRGDIRWAPGNHAGFQIELSVTIGSEHLVKRRVTLVAEDNKLPGFQGLLERLK